MSEANISVIIPVYNVSSYLVECLDSVIQQTYSNLEIILIDDGSTDNSGQICDFYAEKDSRIRVLHQKNMGVSAARNAGLSLATGEYIAFVDADDVISPVFFESLCSIDAEVVQCGFTTKQETLSRCVPTKFEHSNGYEFCEYLQTDRTGAYTALWNKLWKRKCFSNLSFPVGRIHEDEFITWKALYHAHRIAFTDLPLYFYRRHPGSITHADFSEHNLDLLDALRERRQFYASSGQTRLLHLSEATYCYVLRGMMSNIQHLFPDKVKDFRKELWGIYFSVLRASDIGAFKKISLTLRMLSPRLHLYIKGALPWQ